MNAGVRTWTEVGKAAPERLEGGCRLTPATVAAAIEAMTWQPVPTGTEALELPMVPALAVERLVSELRLPKVTAISVDSADLAPFGLYGIEANYSNGRARLYVLDLGSVLTPLASDFWAATS